MMAQFTLAQACSDSIREEMADDFRKRIATILTHGQLSLAIALGLKLGLFDALARAGSAERPASAEEVACLAGCKPRYCREWLCCMACGDLIEVDASGEHFWIADERHSMLSGATPEPFFIMNGMLSVNGSAFEAVATAFKRDGPLGLDYSAYADFYPIMNAFSRALYTKHLVTDLVPMMGMEEALKRGIEVLDVGCGAGFHVIELAKSFPASRFVGVDSGAIAIDEARRDLAKLKLSNVEFLVRDAAELDIGWAEYFDLIINFDAIHDQTRPDKSLAEIYRCLKSSGLLAISEINGTGDCAKDKAEFGEGAALNYAFSLFNCLPVGSNAEDALQLGTMWGVEKARAMLEAAGFVDISVEPLPFYAENVLYRAHKKPQQQHHQ